MRLTDFTITKHRQRRDLWRRRAEEGLLLEVSDEFVLFAVSRAVKEHRMVRKLLKRTQHVRTSVFNLNAYSEHQCLRDFRFKSQHIGILAEKLEFSGRTQRNEYIIDRVTAMCILLHRLATPIRWCDVEMKFGVFSAVMSETFWEMVELLHNTFGHLLNFRGSFLQSRAQLHADAIYAAGAPLDRCVGFIDCTKVRMSRPGGHGSMQRSTYSGHKRMHCLVYQTLTTPDGLMFALHGPEVGRRHDLTLYRESGWDEILENFLMVEGVYFYIFGDSAYLLRPWMQRPFYRGLATEAQRTFNTKMSAVRVSVEHNYKDLKQYWVSQDFARNLRVRKAPIALLYKASALLLNFHACLYKRGQVQEQFETEPPSLDEYMNAV